MIPIFFSLLDMIKDFVNQNEITIQTGTLPGPIIDLQEAMSDLAITTEAIASAPVILLAAGITIFLGVAGESFFKKTGIPDVAFLMILGVILGPLLGIVQPASNYSNCTILCSNCTNHNHV